MRIAITGASGFLGAEVVRELSGHDLVLLGRSLKTLEDKFPDLCCAETDYSPQYLAPVLDGCDAVIHLAALRYQREFRRFQDYAENLQVADSVFSVCKERKVGVVVFSSTYGIYGQQEPPFKEYRISPTNFYSLSKYFCEQLAEQYDVKFRALRFAQLIGAHEREGFMLRTFLDKARNGEDLTVFGTGKGARDYLYVKDAARACEVALTGSDVSGVFNVGSNRAVSHLELAEAVARIIGEDRIKVILDDTKPDDASVLLMDSSLFMEKFQWEPRFTSEEALRDIKRIWDAGMIINLKPSKYQ